MWPTGLPSSKELDLRGVKSPTDQDLGSREDLILLSVDDKLWLKLLRLVVRLFLPLLALLLGLLWLLALLPPLREERKSPMRWCMEVGLALCALLSGMCTGCSFSSLNRMA